MDTLGCWVPWQQHGGPQGLELVWCLEGGEGTVQREHLGPRICLQPRGVTKENLRGEGLSPSLCGAAPHGSRAAIIINPTSGPICTLPSGP